MRFQVAQTLFAVHFGYNKNVPRTYGFFGMPMLFDNDEPDDINFIKLEVAEHHKVPDCYDEKRELKCDGYLLKDETGTVFANQYPTASYGQISDESNRRFAIHIKKGESGLLNRMTEENPKAIFEFHLLSDVLERIQRGIKDLGDVKITDENSQRSRTKRDHLIKLYDRIVKEFGEKYPDYRLAMVWKPPFKKSNLIWPDVSIYKRISFKQAEAMSKEDIMKDFMSDGRFELVYKGDDRLVIENADGTYYIDGKLTEVKTINIYFAEKSEEDGKPVFYVHQTEYFPRSWIGAAVDCFITRLKNGGQRAANTGMSLEAIAARDKEPEGIQQVRT